MTEALGRGTTDSVLNWGGGYDMKLTAGWGDTTISGEVERCTGITAQHVTATEPDAFSRTAVTPVSNHAAGNWNMDKIGATPLANPDVVRSRR